MKTKICGITNLQDALCAQESGADYIGFIFYDKSPRYIAPDKAGQIIDQLDSDIETVGVFVNETSENILSIKYDSGIDFIQLHGDEDLEFCNNFNAHELIKVIRTGKNKKKEIKFTGADLDYILLDTYKEDKYGGTGQTLDWDFVKEFCETFKGNLILSGGLNIENIEDAIEKVKPFCVDISSGVEKQPGIKDHKKIREIVRLIK